MQNHRTTPENELLKFSDEKRQRDNFVYQFWKREKFPLVYFSLVPSQILRLE